MKALLLDDDRSILALLQRIMERHGFDVTAYTDPTLCALYSAESCRACPMVAQGCPDLILTDVVMRYVNGIDFVAAVRRIGCKCPHIAMMSGDWQDSYVERASVMGVTLFTKPFHIQEFERWLDTVAYRETQLALPSTAAAVGAFAVNF